MTIKYYVEGLNGFDVAIKVDRKKEMAVGYETYGSYAFTWHRKIIEIKLNSLDEMRTLHSELLESNYYFTEADGFLEALYQRK